MSIASNFPAIKPTLLLDFANTEELDPRITFTRASTATYYGTETAKAEENLLLQSQNFTTSWTNGNSTDAADVIAAPDGTLTADSITDNATNGAHLVRQSVVNSINTTYVVSCFLKAGTSNFAYLGFYDPATAQRYFCADFDLSGGTVRTSVAGTSGTLTSATITSVGSGWYRCVVIGQVSAGTAQAVVVGLSNGSTAFNTFGTISYVGTGSDIYAWGAQLEQRSAVTAYTPTTTQAITNYIPVLETAASGVARFDHNPTTFESLGLLIEESRTNLLTYSDQFNDATWTKSASSITANTVVSPDGTLNADKLVEDATSASHFVRQNVTSTVGVTYVSSVYLKAAERTSAVVIHFDGSSFCGVSVNLSTGILSAPPSDLSLTNASATATITSVENGWYRVSVSRAQVSTTSTQLRVSLQSGSNGVYTGDGYSGIYIWGAQLEAGAFATSYIPTVASQVTRAADAASMTGTNFSSWYNAAEGTLYGESATNNPAAVSSSVVSLFASASNYQRIRHVGALIDVTAVSSGTTTVDTDGVAVTVGAFGKTAMGFKVNDYAQYTNASSGGTDSSASLPVGINVLNIGSTDGSGNNLNGTIRKISYYPIRVSNTNLQALTS